MTLLIIYATVSIFFSFLCSILEAVLLSVTPTFINVKKNEGKAYASELEALKKDVDKPLIAILTLNTIAHTVGAILVGVQAESLPFKIDFLGINIVGIVSAIMTLLILVVSEIIPKTIGATYWKKLGNFTAKTLNMLIFPLKWTGILWLLQLTTKLIGGKNAHGSVLSREDFTAMTEIAEEEGVFQESESKVIRNMLNFKEVEAKDIMTPRTVLKTVDETQTIQTFYDENQTLRFSRIPVFKEKSDNITGYFLKDNMLEAIIKGNGEKPLSSIKREILVTKRDLPIPNLFEKLIEQREHIALVVDEYGSVSGLVSQEDVIETLLGQEIMDESDNVADLQQLARRSWERRAKRLGIIDESDKE
ncbi:CBS domain containing-hemolysin-like protein [Lutibacter sp. Hel_I_33_5]|uniref:CNNM domain-containing protein n=1 Tax=Lutibacter sp. Hel_I_33_5 TaxID=1566289 RepID=UPI0011A61BAA|nr:CNNM domain-containing protein [Lutibacter sp. Hel_I_33_5]TVZ56131.1 CBS domain containing-hemolysin-like protein [Lutibacter sp. Hel_I_33_5]